MTVKETRADAGFPPHRPFALSHNQPYGKSGTFGSPPKFGNKMMAGYNRRTVHPGVAMTVKETRAGAGLNCPLTHMKYLPIIIFLFSFPTTVKCDTVRWWLPHVLWQVALDRSNLDGDMSCTMYNSRTINGKLQGDGISQLKGHLNIMSFDERADPQTDTELTVVIDARLIGKFSVTGATINPNVLPMIMARIPGQQESALLSQIRDGREIEVKASSFSHHFELIGSNLAINDLFDCISTLHTP
jgi:hypothetical protein